MQIITSSDEIISSQEQLKQLLLDRIPANQQSGFLNPVSPLELAIEDFGVSSAELDKAVTLIEKAIKDQQKILIFGDYDCDGVTATAVLWEALKIKGVSAQPFLPHREKHGYGLTQTALDEILAIQKPDLVITVDNGIVANKEVAWLKEQGVKVIITDHHEPHGDLPKADALIHTTQVTGVGVAWLLGRELLNNRQQAGELLDLTVLGTIADQVPLIGANRSLATAGLLALQQTTRPSLLTLAELAGTDLSQATVNTINYSLAPRINAMGRLYSAMDALRALVTRNPKNTRELMSKLNTVNGERQDITEAAISKVKDSLLSTPEDNYVLAVGDYHEGVIGLIASKLVDKYHKPSLVISNRNGAYKASCRSIPGVHLTELLRSLDSDLFTSLGGHAMAAGFSIEPEKLAEFHNQLRSLSQKSISADLLKPQLKVLGQLAWPLLNLETMDTINQFTPYGAGNEEPLFLLKDIEIVDQRPVGKNGAHLKIQLRNLADGLLASAICFQFKNKLPNNLAPTQLAIRLKTSTYRRGSVDIEIVAAT